jgi:hypothetical protein
MTIEHIILTYCYPAIFIGTFLEGETFSFRADWQPTSVN